MKLLSRKSLIPIFAAAASVGLGGYLYNTYDDVQIDEPTPIVQSVDPVQALGYNPETVTSFDIVHDYVTRSEHRDRMLIFNPDGEHGIFEVDKDTGQPATNRSNLYTQLLAIADQLVEDGVGNPEEIIGIVEGSLRGGNAFIEPHSVSPEGDEEHQHYAYLTPFPAANTTHGIEQQVGWMNDPTVTLVSPYSSLSHEVFVGLHEEAHAIELLSNLRDDKSNHATGRGRLLAEATADAYAMLAYEHAGYKYADVLDGLDGELMQRVADVRAIAVLQSVISMGNMGSADIYYTHVFTDSFAPIVEQIKADGVLQDMSIEDMAIMARDHVREVSQRKVTPEYMEEMRQVLTDAAKELRGLTFHQQEDLIRGWLAEDKFAGNAREYFSRYIGAVDRIYAAQVSDPAQLLEQWEENIRQTDENGVDLERAWALEGKMLRAQISHMMQTVAHVNEHQGHEAARDLYERMMNGDPEISDASFREKLRIWAEIGEEFGYDKKVENLDTPPHSVVRMNVDAALDHYAGEILGDNRGRVALIDIADAFVMDDEGNVTFDPDETAPDILDDVKDHLRENGNQYTPGVLASLKQLVGESVGNRVPQDSFVITALTGTPDGETFALFSPPPREMTTQQMEQRISIVYDPDVTWTSTISSDAMRSYLSFRSFFELKMIFEQTEDAKQKAAGNDEYFENEDRIEFGVNQDMVQTPPGRMMYNAHLDLYGLLMMRKAEAENPGTFGSTVYELGARIAQLRDLSVMNTFITDDGIEHALDYDTSRYIEPFLSYIQYGFTDEELREMSVKDVVDTVQDFMQTRQHSFTADHFKALYQELGQFYKAEIEGEDTSTMDFHERRDFYNRVVAPQSNAFAPNSLMADLIDRMNEASWEVSPRMSTQAYTPLWKQSIMPLDRFTREEALLRVQLERSWIMQQAQASGISGPRADAEPSADTPLLPEQRMELLNQFQEQLVSTPVYYSPEEAYEILTENLTAVTINVNNRLVQIPVSPEMIARNGREINVPPGMIAGVNGPITVQVPMEYIAVIDPNAEEKREAAESEAENTSYIMRVPLPNGGAANVVVTEDMISEDGNYVTLPEGSLPPGYENADGDIKIFISPAALQQVKPEEPEEEPTVDENAEDTGEATTTTAEDDPANDNAAGGGTPSPHPLSIPANWGPR